MKKRICSWFGVHGSWIIVCCLLFTLIGCDAFVRKFTRKSKKEKVAETELVLAPEEYKPPFRTKEEVYRQYFLFWKSWQGELVEALAPITSASGRANHKKQTSCALESISNLEQLRKLLNEAKQKQLDVYITRMNKLKSDIVGDPYGSNTMANHLKAEDIKRGILRDFSYKKVAKDMLDIKPN